MATQYYLEWWQKNTPMHQIRQGATQRITMPDGSIPASEAEATAVARAMLDQGRSLWVVPYTAHLHIHNHGTVGPIMDSCRQVLLEET
jgi:hypothetical protein